ncbi:hypothetical protein [Rhizobium sp. BR 314]|uniref:hypothetical protein n=1 Tax=Rhizobium sp. BR 314 TaxID=3040013 RepID=UPI0039BFF578
MSAIVFPIADCGPYRANSEVIYSALWRILGDHAKPVLSAFLSTRKPPSKGALRQVTGQAIPDRELRPRRDIKAALVQREHVQKLVE